MHSSRSKLIAIVAVLWFAISAQAFAQSNPRYIRFAGVPSAVKGALYAPDAPQKAPHVAILVIPEPGFARRTSVAHPLPALSPTR